jgi:hypothetical protein
LETSFGWSDDCPRFAFDLVGPDEGRAADQGASAAVIERFVDGWNCHHAKAFAEGADFRGDAQPWSDSTPAPGKFRNQESMSTKTLNPL